MNNEQQELVSRLSHLTIDDMTNDNINDLVDKIEQNNDNLSERTRVYVYLINEMAKVLHGENKPEIADSIENLIEKIDKCDLDQLIANNYFTELETIKTAAGMQLSYNPGNSGQPTSDPSDGSASDSDGTQGTDQTSQEQESNQPTIPNPQPDAGNDSDDENNNPDEHEDDEEKEIEIINNRINELTNEINSVDTTKIDNRLDLLNGEKDKFENLFKNNPNFVIFIQKQEELEQVRIEIDDMMEEISEGTLATPLEYNALMNKKEQLERECNDLAFTVVNSEIDERRTAAVNAQKEYDEMMNSVKDGMMYTPDEIVEIEQNVKKTNNELNLLAEYTDKSKVENIISIYNELSVLNKEKKSLSNVDALKAEKAKLEEIKNAYEKILNDVTSTLNTDEFKALSDDEKNAKIKEAIDNHPEATKLNGYEKADKLKSELQKDAFDKLKSLQRNNAPEPETPAVTENQIKLWQKALAAAGGFVLGLGMSCVPGVGTIRMGIATTKLVVSGINFISNKLPDGPIAKVTGKISEMKEKMLEKHPKIAAGIEKINALLKDPRVQCAINGVAAGYLTGNIVEMITGKTVTENFKTLIEKQKGINSVDQVLPAETLANQDLGEAAKVVEPTSDVMIPTSINPVQGEVFDLSSIQTGLVSSTSTNQVNLMTGVAKNAVFDRAVTLDDGTVMWHFKQANGLGYAWFKADDVKNALGLVEEAGRSL